MTITNSFQQSLDYFEKHNRVKEFSSHSGRIFSIEWNYSGSKLATCSSDKTINIYSLENSRLSRSLTHKGHADSVDQLAWHPSDSEVLASVSPDGAVKIWDCRAKRCTNTFQFKCENINLAWSPDAKYIAVGNKLDLLSIIDIRIGLPPVQSEQFTFEVNEFAWAPSNSGHTDLFFISTGLGNILVYHGTPGSMVKQTSLQAHSVSSICLEFSKDGQHFAVGSADALVSIWDMKEFVCQRTLSRLEWPVRCLSWSHDSELLASAGEDNFIDIAHVKTGKQVYKINNASQGNTFVLAWHPKQLILAYSTETKYERDQSTVKLFGIACSNVTEIESSK